MQLDHQLKASGFNEDMQQEFEMQIIQALNSRVEKRQAGHQGASTCTYHGLNPRNASQLNNAM